MTKTSKHNPFDYLETNEEINEYLNNAYMDDDPKMFIIALGYLAKKKRHDGDRSKNRDEQSKLIQSPFRQR